MGNIAAGRDFITVNKSILFDQNLEVTMRDGTKTYADVFRPAVDGKYPVLMTRTPYDKSSAASRSGALDAINAASQGYAVVIQDVRGRYSSEGEFYTFVNETDDGADSIEWAAEQSWSSGKVGMYGASYVGATQWLAAKSETPSLTAIVPTVTASDYHEGWAWQGGAFELGFNLSWSVGSLAHGNWNNLSRQLKLENSMLEKLISSKDNLNPEFQHLPLSEMQALKNGLAPYYYDWLSHPEYDQYWQALSIQDSHDKIQIPALNIGGWHDIFQGGTIKNFTGMKKNGANTSARDGQRLLIGPWVHGNTGTLAGSYNYGTMSSRDKENIHGRTLSFFDKWLKGDTTKEPIEKSVRIFVMGINEWRDEDEWPLNRAIDTKFYLHSSGGANSLRGDGSLSQVTPDNEPPDSYHYNPQFPVPTSGGGLCCDDVFMQNGVFDQRPIEERSDVLVYSTPPLEKPIEVTGPISVSLFASTTAKDTDFTAKLVDVDTKGFARNLTDGIIRARFRQPRQPASFVKPGEIIEYSIDLWSTSNVFLKGHQIRLEISSSNFPRFDRNLNTGGEIGSELEFVSALQTVHHSSELRSHVTLPIVDH